MTSGRLRKWLTGLREEKGHAEGMTGQEEREAMVKDKDKKGENGEEDVVR